MNYGFFLFRFTSVVDRDFVLSNVPYVVDEATLCLEPWLPAFLPSPERLPEPSCGCGCLVFQPFAGIPLRFNL